MNSGPRHILKTETLCKGEEYVEIVQELALAGLEVIVLRGTGAIHGTKFRKVFTTREAADHAEEQRRIDALNEGFRFPNSQTGKRTFPPTIADRLSPKSQLPVVEDAHR